MADGAVNGEVKNGINGHANGINGQSNGVRLRKNGEMTANGSHANALDDTKSKTSGENPASHIKVRQLTVDRCYFRDRHFLILYVG